eukprot:1319491-Amorphochlora_amoeboformis.AAC.1
MYYVKVAGRDSVVVCQEEVTSEELRLDTKVPNVTVGFRVRDMVRVKDGVRVRVTNITTQ